MSEARASKKRGHPERRPAAEVRADAPLKTGLTHEKIGDAECGGVAATLPPAPRPSSASFRRPAIFAASALPFRMTSVFLMHEL